jgi:AcrR family transcriptional regulator
MRARICAAALGVFAAKGSDSPVIDDFIKAAGVSRGTFYNHFRTTEELFVATSAWLENELMQAIQGAIAGLDDPLQRLATGVRIWLRHSRDDAVFCAFVVRSRYRGPLVEKHLGADLQVGIRLGRFHVPGPGVARDLVIGTVREAMSRMLDKRMPRGYPDDVARVILRGLGVDARAIRQVLDTELPEARR